MTFEERLAELIEQTPVPERIKPEAIAKMLNEQKSVTKKVLSSYNYGKAPNKIRDINAYRDNPTTHPPTVRMVKRKKGFVVGRAAAALVACVAFVFGVVALQQVGNKQGAYIEERTDIVSASDYADVYKAVQNAFINNGSVLDSGIVGDSDGSDPGSKGQHINSPAQTVAKGQIIEGTDDDSTDSSNTSHESTTTPSTTTDPKGTDGTITETVGTDKNGSSVDNTDGVIKGISGQDGTIKTEKSSSVSYQWLDEWVSDKSDGILLPSGMIEDGSVIYYISGGAVSVIDKNSGLPKLVKRIANPDGAAREIFVHGDRLTIVSQSQALVPYESSVALSQAQSQAPATVAGENQVASGTSISHESVSLSGVQSGSGSTAAWSDLPKELAASDGSESSGNAEGTIVIATPESDSTGSGDISENNQQSVANSTGSVGNAESSDTFDINMPGVSNSNTNMVLQKRVSVEIYNISDAYNPVPAGKYVQNGEYVSAVMTDDGAVYLLTNYAQYQTKPLEGQEDLDNYVPSYYLNGEKFYVEAKDICIPASAKTGSASYGILSGLNPQATSPLVSVKAVLGDAVSADFSKTAVYMASEGSVLGKDSKQNTSILKFQINSGSISYMENAVLEGTLTAGDSLHFSDNTLSVVTKISHKATGQEHSVFTFGSDLNPIGSISGISVGKTLTDVCHAKGMMFLITGDGSRSALASTVSLANGAAPKLVENAASSLNAGRLFPFGNGNGVAIGTELDENGNQTGIYLAVYDTGNMNVLADISLNKSGVLPEKFNSRGLYLDPENGLIGFPTVSKGDYGVSNRYYMLSYKDGKLERLGNGVLEYNDVGSGSAFTEAIVDSGMLYLMSPTRVVVAQLSDLKVISTISI